MSLPNSGISWSDYRISTPTFRLTPVEKPDTSPFLVHMTGKGRLIQILKGENAGEEGSISLNCGFIRASIPAFDTSRKYYNSAVVCFTESPIFALDFFRYRSYRRWADDQRFGLGFSKEVLISRHNVRPVIYLDTQTNREILSICNKSENSEILFSFDPETNEGIRETFKRIKPFLFPLLEEESYQGFTWEREWRCPDATGMVFQYKEIKVICCPREERDEILSVLGDFVQGIEIVDSWREYDEVTNYLKNRDEIVSSDALSRVGEIQDLETLKELRQKNDQTVNALIGYYEVFKQTVEGLEGRNINETIEGLRLTSERLTHRIDKLIADQKADNEKKNKEIGH